MDKNAIKKYAIWAREELLRRVSAKAQEYGITSDEMEDAGADFVNDKLLTDTEMKQRTALMAKIRGEGYEQALEEIAYTWFNRFIALRFMEVNGYLPTRVRVFTDDENHFRPQILAEAIHLDLPGIDVDKVIDLKQRNDNDALYKYLLITQCNALSAVLPEMFQKIDDYTELLFPDNVLREGSVLARLVSDIPAEDWTDQVQIIGWLYQYYNTEPNNRVYDGNMSKERIPKELLSAATTIYTPDWPVRYMVENSLGRLWLEYCAPGMDCGNGEDALRELWAYYIDEADQEEEVTQKLEELHKQHYLDNPTQIKLIDPCMGSGHILVYAFEVLFQIYCSQGYTERDIPDLIIQHNLYGLDIDYRAFQLAYFALMMKARQYDRRFLTRGIQPNVCWAGGDSDLSEVGSLLIVENWDKPKTEQLSFTDMSDEYKWLLAQKYDVVITNPPYLGSSRFSPVLDKYVKENYSDEKADLCMAMFKQSLQRLCKPNGFVSFITTSSWMFLSSFEKVRKYLQSNAYISSLVDFGTELFDGKVGHNPIVAWVTRKTRVNYIMTAVRLVDFCYSRREEKESEFFNLKNRYTAQQDNFSKIPGAPVAYWVSEKVLNIFDAYPCINDVGITRLGMTTGENARFVRLWFEVDYNLCIFDSVSQEDLNSKNGYWVPYNKGGNYRKWFGNNDYVLFWKDEGVAIKNFSDEKGRIRSTVPNTEYYFLPCASWSKISSGKISFRYKDNSIFDVAGACFFSRNRNLMYMIGLLNSNVVDVVIGALSPTLNYEGGQIASLPVIYEPASAKVVENTVEENIKLCKTDWDAYETSWDFMRHPMV